MKIDNRLEQQVRDAVASSIARDQSQFENTVGKLQEAGFRNAIGLVLPILAGSIDALVDESAGTDRTALIADLITNVSTGTSDWLGYPWPTDTVSAVMRYAARVSPELPVPEVDRRTAEAVLLSTAVLCIAGTLSSGRRPWNRQLDVVEDSLEATRS